MGEGSRIKFPLFEWSKQITTQSLRPRVGCKHCAQGKHVVFKHLPLGMGCVIEGMNSNRSPGGQETIKGKELVLCTKSQLWVELLKWKESVRERNSKCTCSHYEAISAEGDGETTQARPGSLQQDLVTNVWADEQSFTLVLVPTKDLVLPNQKLYFPLEYSSGLDFPSMTLHYVL